MRNILNMALFSRRSLSDSVAREQISALSNFEGGLMRPEKCGEAEPIRTPFNAADISGPVEWLAKPHGEFFYKKGSPVCLVGEMWNLTRSPDAHFPAGPFINYWTGRFDGKWAIHIGIKNVEDFVREMFRVSGADFGLLTTEVDLKAKNTVATSYSYKGLSMESGIPGLYWINFFSAGLARWLALDNFPKELGLVKQMSDGGLSLQFGESPEHCRGAELLQRQRVALEWLGSEKFFDIHRLDRRANTPDWSNIPLPNPVQSDR